MIVQNFDVLMAYALWAIKIAVCLALGEQMIELAQRRDGASSVRFIKFCIGAMIALQFETILNWFFPELKLVSGSGTVSGEATKVLDTTRLILNLFQGLGVSICAVFAAHAAWKAVHGDKVRWIETFIVCALISIMILNVSQITAWFLPNKWQTLEDRGITSKPVTLPPPP